MDAQPPRLTTTRTPCRRARRLSGLLGAAAVFGLVSASPASARVNDRELLSGAEPVSQPASLVAAAWYRPTSPTCDLPVGCLPVAVPAVYPEGTLHVGVLAGQEESRTYLAFRLPSTGVVTGGSLRVPLAPQADGSVQPETASVRACLVTGEVKDKVAGDVSRPPAADCSVSSPGAARTSAGGSVVSFDLTPFAAEWQGSAVGALAVLPAEAPPPTSTWHLAFSRPDRAGAGIVPLSATLLVDSGATPPPPTSDVPPAPAPQLPVVALDPPLAPGLVPAAGTDQSAPQLPSLAGTPSLVPAAVQAVDTSFAYPGVFLLPPLVLLAAAWLARAFTRDLADVAS